MNKRGMVAWVAALSMALFFVAPALAHHKDGHDRGGASEREGRGEQGQQAEERRPDRGGGQASQARERDDDDGKGSSASSAGRERRPETADRRGGRPDDGDTEAATHPPGNNGTVKIDGEPFDDHPDNEPHVGCVFQIDFYGYDEGDLSATYQLDLHPPTDGGVIHSGSTFIGEDPAGGGTDLDASVTIDLTEELLASGVEPHPIQGHHIKLTVHAEGSIGADVKHKVFWVRCVSEQEALPPEVSALVEELEAEEVEAEEAEAEEVEEAQAKEVEAEELGAEEEQDVLGVRIERAAPAQPAPARVAAVQAQQAAGALPFTGVPVAAYLLAALGLIGSGIALKRRAS